MLMLVSDINLNLYIFCKVFIFPLVSVHTHMQLLMAVLN